MRKTVFFAGEAGQGVDRLAVVFGKIISSFGYSCFIYRDYPSLIRGGRNVNVLTFSDKITRSHDDKAEVIVALTPQTDIFYKKNLHKSGIIIDSSYIHDDDSKNQYEINNIYLGILSKHFSIQIKNCLKIIKKEFIDYKTKAEENFYSGYQKEIILSDIKIKKIGKSQDVCDGNKAIALGAVDGGLQLAFYYPMTPSTGLFTYLKKIFSQKKNTAVKQMEDEIAAANAMLGANYAGKIAMTGSSGGGMALMSETVSFAGMAEIPAIFYVAQRMGPSTGAPTYTSQGDIKFILNIGHGEFPRAVLSPGDVQESYKAAKGALYFANKYRMPVFILSDKHIAESYSSYEKFSVSFPKASSIKYVKQKNPYKSYALTKNGISSAVKLGGDEVFRVTSYEHDEYGYITEDPVLINKMNEKRNRKTMFLKKEIELLFPGISVYGCGKRIIVFTGSPKGAVLDALSYGLKFRAIQINRLYPFPEKKLFRLLYKSDFYVVENNITGQLNDLIKENCRLSAKKSLLRYDGRPFTPEDIKKFYLEINK